MSTTRIVREMGYGFFHGGDPRLFHPDEECSTPQEIATWRAWCARWDAGDTSEPPAEEHGPWVHVDGRVVLGDRPEGDGWHGVCSAKRSFGMGTYEFDVEDTQVPCPRCGAAFWESEGGWQETENRLICADCWRKQ